MDITTSSEGMAVKLPSNDGAIVNSTLQFVKDSQNNKCVASVSNSSSSDCLLLVCYTCCDWPITVCCCLKINSWDCWFCLLHFATATAACYFC